MSEDKSNPNSEAVHAADFKVLVPRLLIGNKDIKKYTKTTKTTKKRRRR